MNKPMRVIEGSMQPHEPFWAIRDSAEHDGIEVEFDGVISEYSWWGDEVTPAAFKKELYEKGDGKPVTLLVNSPGGEVIAASVIRSILQEYPGQVTADIVGLAASAATIVITGADRVRMRESALMMIHDPSTIAWGTIDDIKQALGLLETVKDGIIDTYETRTGKSRAELARMMKNETWMTAREAKEHGFVDEVVSGSIKKAPANNLRAGFLNCLEASAIPAELAAHLVELSAEEVSSQAVEPLNVAGDVPVADAASIDPEVVKLRNYATIFGRK